MLLELELNKIIWFQVIVCKTKTSFHIFKFARIQHLLLEPKDYNGKTTNGDG